MSEWTEAAAADRLLRSRKLLLLPQTNNKEKQNFHWKGHTECGFTHAFFSANWHIEKLRYINSWMFVAESAIKFWLSSKNVYFICFPHMLDIYVYHTVVGSNSIYLLYVITNFSTLPLLIPNKHLLNPDLFWKWHCFDIASTSLHS